MLRPWARSRPSPSSQIGLQPNIWALDCVLCLTSRTLEGTRMSWCVALPHHRRVVSRKTIFQCLAQRVCSCDRHRIDDQRDPPFLLLCRRERKGAIHSVVSSHANKIWTYDYSQPDAEKGCLLHRQFARRISRKLLLVHIARPVESLFVSMRLEFLFPPVGERTATYRVSCGLSTRHHNLF